MMRVGMGLCMTLLVMVAVVCLLSVCLSMEVQSAPSTDSQNVMEQLRVHLPSPIQEERVGMIDMVQVGNHIVVTWLAKNTLVYPFPPSGPSGNVIYIASRDPHEGTWSTETVPVGSLTIKENLQAVASPDGDIHIYWTEDGTLRGCIYADGKVGAAYQLSDIEISDYSPVPGPEGIDIYAVRSDGTSIHWLRDQNGTVEDAPLSEGSGLLNISDPIALTVDDNILLSYIGANGTTGTSAVSLLLLDASDILDRLWLSNVSFEPTHVLITPWQGKVLAIPYLQDSGRFSIHTVEVLDEGLRVVGDPIELSTGHRMDQLKVITSGDILRLHSINPVIYIGTKVQRYELDLTTEELVGPINATPQGLSPMEEMFAILEGSEGTFLAVSGRYQSGGGMSTKRLSKLVILEGTLSNLVPTALLNPRVQTPPEVRDLFSLEIPGDGQWVSVATNANATWEVSLFHVEDGGKGELRWMASTPWYSTLTFLAGQMVDRLGLPLVICNSYYDVERDPYRLTLFEYRDNEHALAKLVELDHDVIGSRSFNTWHSGVLDNGTLVISSLSSHDEVSFMLLEPGKWVHVIPRTIDAGRDVRGLYIHTHGGLVHLFTLERQSGMTQGLIRELSLSGTSVSVQNTWMMFTGGYYDYSGIRVRRIGATEIAVIAERDNGYTDDHGIIIFDQSNGTIDPTIDVELPRDYDLYGVDVAPFGKDALVLSTWAMDVTTLHEDGRYVMDLVLVVMDRTDPTDQDIFVPLAISSPNDQVIYNPPDLVIFCGSSTEVMMTFTFYEVEPETTSLFSVLYDPLEPGLTPLSPPDGAIINRTTIEFSATPIGDIWESATEYQVVVFLSSEPDEPFVSSSWSPLPVIDITLPEGRYSWTFVYRRFHVIREQDWKWGIILDATPPSPDAGGPYINGSIGTPMQLDGSRSRDETGIVTYKWTVFETSPIEEEGADAFMWFTPTLTGTTQVRLEVVDLAGNRASTATIVIVKPPIPVLDMDLPTEPVEGEDTILSCAVRDTHEGIGYSFIWNLGFTGGSGPSITVVFPDDGTYTVCTEVWDDFGQYNVWEGSVAVANAPPRAEPLSDRTVEEFEPLHLVGRAYDVPADNLTFSWTLDDVEISEGLDVDLSLDDGAYNITLLVEDDSGAMDSSSATITVTPSISDVFIQAGYDVKGKELIIRWIHDYEPDFESLKIRIYADKNDDELVWEHTIGSQGINSHNITTKGFPDIFYVQVVMMDDSLSSSSDLVEVQRPAEPDAGRDDFSLLFLVVLLVAMLVVLLTVMLYRNRSRIDGS